LLGEVGRRDAIGPLVSCLANAEDDWLLTSVLDQLRDLNAVEAAEPIMTLLEGASVDGGYWHGSAANALIAIANKAISPRLVHATKHPSPKVRMCAVHTLGAFGGSPAIEAITSLLDDSASGQYTFQNTTTHFAVHEIAAKALDLTESEAARDLLCDYRRRHPNRFSKGWLSRWLSIDADSSSPALEE
jgi:HEAT repeat protein